MEHRIRLALPSGAFEAAVRSGDLADLGGIRHGGELESDLDFVVHSFDSALPYLASIGSQAQWGTQPFSETPHRVQSFSNFIEQSYSQHHHRSSEKVAVEHNNGNKDVWKKMLILEVKPSKSDDVGDKDAKWTRVSAMGITQSTPEYVPLDLMSQSQRNSTNYLYLQYLISDRRAGPLAKNTANVLIQHAIEQCRLLQKPYFYGDCWRGNNDGLLKYYQKLGFESIGAFDVPDKHGPGLRWTGYLIKMQIDVQDKNQENDKDNSE